MERLRRRVPRVELAGIATLPGMELRWDKRSRDGSGKCHLGATSDGLRSVHGALFRLTPDGKPLLDAVEEGYDAVGVEVRVEGRSVPAFTYLARRSRVRPGLLPYAWYRDLVAAGAAGLGLPPAYVAHLRRAPAMPDSDPERARRNRRALPCGTDPGRGALPGGSGARAGV